MQSAIRTCRHMGFCWCCPQPKKNRENAERMKQFLAKKRPIFWVIGPKGIETERLANLLKESSQFKLLVMGDLLKQEIEKGKIIGQTINFCQKNKKPVPDEIYIEIFKEQLLSTYEDAKGYIICDFPTTIAQAKLFEMEICRVKIVIYYTYDDGDRYKKLNEKNPEEDFFVEHRKYVSLHKRYENKTIKVTTDKGTQLNVIDLINDLDKYWGYKFVKPELEY